MKPEEVILIGVGGLVAVAVILRVFGFRADRGSTPSSSDETGSPGAGVPSDAWADAADASADGDGGGSDGSAGEG